MGSNVVANGSGAINLTGLTFSESFPAGGTGIIANTGTIAIGGLGNVNVNVYTGITGPTSFGSGGLFLADIGSGDFVTLKGVFGQLLVPQGYVSGAALSDSMTFNNATLASLGVTPGTYEWTWGAGANQNFTLLIESAGVPDGGATVMLLGAALGALGMARRFLKA